MELHVISIFPDMFKSVIEYGVVGRAIKQKALSLNVWNPRDFTDDKHRVVDDRPYGGGPGMVMMAEPLAKAIITAKKSAKKADLKVIYLSPQGKRFDHSAAQGFASNDGLILLAGRYEGVDERVLQAHVDEEWSIGDYVLSGGELPAMVMIDAIARLLPGCLGNVESAQQDSFVDGLLDYPHYTRPEQLEGMQSIPEVLLKGDHAAISAWRLQQALGRTWLRRPELLENLSLTEQQQALLMEFKLKTQQ